MFADKNKNPFQTPDNYFDGLQQSINTKTIGTNKRIIPFYKRPTVWISSVAAMVLIVFVFWQPIFSPYASPEDKGLVQNKLYDLYFDDGYNGIEIDSTVIYDEYVYLFADE